MRAALLFSASLLASVALHTLFAVVMARGLVCVSAPDRPARLDVSCVRIALADADDGAAEAQGRRERRSCAEARGTDVSVRPPETASLPLERVETLATVDPAMPSLADVDLPEPSVAPTRLSEPARAGIDAPPRPWRSIAPEYPRAACRRGEQGRVTLEIDVSAAGEVTDVRVAVSSGFPLLDQAAARAARTARFSPARSDGAAVASTVRLPVDFALR